MTQNAANVHIPKPNVGGAMWSAPEGTVVPTDASTKLNDAFKSLGYLHSDGITEATEIGTESTVAYGGDEVAVSEASKKRSFKFHPIETNPYTLAEWYGQDNVTVDTTSGKPKAVVANSKAAPVRAYVSENLLSETLLERTVIPRGKVTGVGERKYNNSDATGAEITVTPLPDEKGNLFYKYYAEIPTASGEVSS